MQSLQLLVIVASLGSSAAYQLRGAALPSRPRPLVMQEPAEPVGPLATETNDDAFPFGKEMGRPSLSGGKLTPPTPVDESKVMAKGLPLPYIYAMFAVVVVLSVVTGDDSAAHGFRMPS